MQQWNGRDRCGLASFGYKGRYESRSTKHDVLGSLRAIVQIGAIPVLIDIDPDDLQMSFEESSKDI